MALSSTEIDQIGPGLTVWHRYDSKVRAELFSTAISTDFEILLVDPIEVPNDQLPIGSAVVAAIVVTNANHIRDSEYFSQKFSAPIYARTAAGISSARDPHGLGGDLQIIEIEGAAPGEIALLSRRDAGTLILGDALINFGSHGFAFLPAKYCSNHKLMQKSLGKLLDLQFERMLFAHGTPIMSHARDRLAALLAENQ